VQNGFLSPHVVLFFPRLQTTSQSSSVVLDSNVNMIVVSVVVIDFRLFMPFTLGGGGGAVPSALLISSFSATVPENGIQFKEMTLHVDSTSF
jgi:hypothetical protein